MSVAGINAPANPPKIAREIKLRVGDLFDRYSFEDVIAEIARQKPKFDIYVCPTGAKLMDAGKKDIDAH